MFTTDMNLDLMEHDDGDVVKWDWTIYKFVEEKDIFINSQRLCTPDVRESLQFGCVAV